MKRREFMKLSAASGLALTTFGAATAHAAEGYQGRFFVAVNAGGGWDPTSFCDPKGRANEAAENPVNMYFHDEIGTAGPFHYAPGFGAFFEKFKSELLVINGLDTQTNGHDSGSRHTWSGKLTEGYPAFAALMAAALDPTRPLAFLSNGGYDHTAGLVAPTRVGQVGSLAKLAYPNRVDPSKEDKLYHPPAVEDRLAAARKARLDRLQQQPQLPRRQHSLGLFHAARSGGDDLKKLTEVLPQDLESEALKRQSQLAIAAYKAGLAVSATLNMGGFDTHGNHDQTHIPRLHTLLDGVDFLMEEAARQGVADKVVVMVGSDFGRTPWYNDGNGKDHWSITSAMLMGAGISGGRVVGATDAYHKPLTINAQTLALDPAGVRITPEHVQHALREVMGVASSEVSQLFPLSVDPLPELLLG